MKKPQNSSVFDDSDFPIKYCTDSRSFKAQVPILPRQAKGRLSTQRVYLADYSNPNGFYAFNPDDGTVAF